jgi:hypothetical protein
MPTRKCQRRAYTVPIPREPMIMFLTWAVALAAPSRLVSPGQGARQPTREEIGGPKSLIRLTVARARYGPLREGEWAMSNLKRVGNYPDRPSTKAQTTDAAT